FLFQESIVDFANCVMLSSVWIAGMISTNAINGAGLKKWMPIHLSGCRHAAAIDVMDKLDVLEAKIVLVETMFSSCWNTCFLISRFSMMASMISSLSFNVLRS